MYFTTIKPDGRYCMLLRKSREDIEAERAGKFETLTYHEQELNRLADSLGIKITRIFRELVSGDRLDESPETQELIREVMRGKWDGVLAKDVQRISRGDMIDQGTILNAFRYSDTLIITPKKTFCLSDQYDADAIEQDLMFGRRELSMIKTRLVGGKEAKSREGQYLASIPPFGWRKVVIDRKKTLEPDENHDLLVKMYEDVATGRRTPSGIAADFNRIGFRTIRGGYWDKKTVANVLRNPTNIGKIRWDQKMTTIEFDDDMKRKRVRRLPKNESASILVDGLHMGKSRVTPELFEAANRWLETHKGSSVHSNKPLQNPLAGILVCAECGRPMQRTLAPIKSGRKKGEKQERISHPLSNRNNCYEMSSDFFEVIDAVVNSLSTVVNDLKLDLKADEGETASLIQQRIDLASREILEAKRGIDNLIRLAEKGFISDEEFATRRSELDTQIERAEKFKKSERKKLDTKEDTSKLKIKAEKAIKDLKNYTGRAKEVNDLLKDFADRIEYRKDPQSKIIELEIFFREI